MQRDVIKQLGINLNGSIGGGASVSNSITDTPFTAFNQNLSDTFFKGVSNNVNATMRAMERAGVIRTLAEPTLNGNLRRVASFLVGAKFPVPGAVPVNKTSAPRQSSSRNSASASTSRQSCWRDGRISLKVMSEVSELSTENSLPLLGGAASLPYASGAPTQRSKFHLAAPSAWQVYSGANQANRSTASRH